MEFHDEFAVEVEELPIRVTQKLIAVATILSQEGPGLGRPYADTLKGARHTNMKELRFSADGGVWRVAYAFDPQRKAILLVGGDKRRDKETHFYSRLIAIADERFSRYLENSQSAKKESK